ncbi:hypothetical protein [Leucobacter celer]|uniref:hypothetical protein n=1 Tax=Leucobacter celer TaxID=668625 RepID=UPI0012FA2C27|nr:hypothetical protein [Leucobacter celer]
MAGEDSMKKAGRSARQESEGGAPEVREQEQRDMATRQTRGGFTFEELAVLYAARFERSLFREPGDTQGQQVVNAWRNRRCAQLDEDTEWITSYDPEGARYIRDYFLSINWAVRHGEQVEQYRNLILHTFEFGLAQSWLEFMLEEADRASTLELREWALEYGITVPPEGPIPEPVQQEIRDAYRADCSARDDERRRGFDVVKAVLGLGAFPSEQRREELVFALTDKAEAVDDDVSGPRDRGSETRARRGASRALPETFGLSEEQIRDVVEDYRPRMPIKPVAKQLGISPAQVVALLQQRSSVRVIREKPDEEDLAEMRRRFYEDDESYEKIGRALGYSGSGVRVHLKKAVWADAD